MDLVSLIIEKACRACTLDFAPCYRASVQKQALTLGRLASGCETYSGDFVKGGSGGVCYGAVDSLQAGNSLSMRQYLAFRCCFQEAACYATVQGVVSTRYVRSRICRWSSHGRHTHRERTLPSPSGASFGVISFLFIFFPVRFFQR